MFDTLLTLALLTASPSTERATEAGYAAPKSPEKVAFVRESRFAPPSEKPIVAKSHRSEVEPELVSTCHLNRAGSCWSED